MVGQKYVIFWNLWIRQITFKKNDLYSFLRPCHNTINIWQNNDHLNFEYSISLLKKQYLSYSSFVMQNQTFFLWNWGSPSPQVKSECVHRSRATCGRLGVGWVSAQKWLRLLLATCCLGIHILWTGQASPIFKLLDSSEAATVQLTFTKTRREKTSPRTTCKPY